MVCTALLRRGGLGLGRRLLGRRRRRRISRLLLRRRRRIRRLLLGRRRRIRRLLLGRRRLRRSVGLSRRRRRDHVLPVLLRHSASQESLLGALEPLHVALPLPALRALLHHLLLADDERRTGS